MKSFGCRCAERAKPAKDRAWLVVQRHSRRSAFDGYRIMWSPYSFVVCLSCGECGRTDAAFVDQLKDGVPVKPGERDPGGKGWRAK